MVTTFPVKNQKLVFEQLGEDAMGFWVNPINYEYFSSVIKKAIAYLKYGQEWNKDLWNSMFVRSEYRLVKVNLSAIEFIESIGNYLRIYLMDGKPIMTLMTFKAMLEKLPKDRFIRIHRRYIIAIDKIQSLRNRKVQLQSKELPVGSSFIADVNVLVK